MTYWHVVLTNGRVLGHPFALRDAAEAYIGYWNHYFASVMGTTASHIIETNGD